MPLHQNEDGTWQWGKSGKKYKKKQDAIKQMKAIFASGYVEKKASYKSYTDILGMIKEAARGWTANQARRAAANQVLNDVRQFILDPKAAATEYTGKNPYMLVKNKLGLPYTFKDIKSARQAYDTSPIGYLKNPQIARRNALAMKQSSGNRYATNRGAAGAFQVRPVAMEEGKRKKFIPADATVQDLFKPGNTYGVSYYDYINRNVTDPARGYLRYYKGPNTKIKNPKSVKEVRRYMQILDKQNKNAQQASPAPVAK